MDYIKILKIFFCSIFLFSCQNKSRQIDLGESSVKFNLVIENMLVSKELRRYLEKKGDEISIYLLMNNSTQYFRDTLISTDSFKYSISKIDFRKSSNQKNIVGIDFIENYPEKFFDIVPIKTIPIKNLNSIKDTLISQLTIKRLNVTLTHLYTRGKNNWNLKKSELFIE